MILAMYRVSQKKRTFRIAINKQPRVNPWPCDQGLTSCSESSGLTSNSESAFFWDTLYNTCSLFDLTRLSYNEHIIRLAILLPPQTKIFYRQRRGRGSHGGRFTQAPTNLLLLLRGIQMLSRTPTMDTSSKNPVTPKTIMTSY